MIDPQPSTPPPQPSAPSRLPLVAGLVVVLLAGVGTARFLLRGKPEEPVATPGVNYAYVAPELEQLSAVQKHLLRLRPTHAHAIQAKLRELHKALGLPPAGR